MPKPNVETLSLFDLMQRFPTQQDAIDCFEHIRWGDTPTCTKCGKSEKITKQVKKHGRYWCGSCRGYFTAFTETPLEYSLEGRYTQVALRCLSTCYGSQGYL